MATIKFGKDLEYYARAIAKMGEESEGLIEKAVYEGAAVVADQMRTNMNSLPTIKGQGGMPPMGTSEDPIEGLTGQQKKDLMDGFGLAPIRNDNDYVHTKAGFDGYGSMPTKKYPKGLPNQLLARAVESGTSFRKKTPFVRKAVTASKKKAVETMQKVIDDELRRIVDGN